jgi:hypothetical protein
MPGALPGVDYRSVPGFADYRVGSDGSIWSSKSGGWEQMRLSRTPQGNVKANLRRGTKNYVRDVGPLVLEAFVGPRPEDHEARHRDGNRGNNALTNLFWNRRLVPVESRMISGSSCRLIRNQSRKERK